ncbi:MAG: hypothetical protein DI605_20515 [Sphingomonas sp.]|nr:MAG: hypothetical protein DI605_20515 [Sphingomonas sp.]
MDQDDDDRTEPDLPPATAPDTISLSMRAFALADAADRLGNKIAAYVRMLSRAIDLSRLDGLTIAYDYDAALAELDRGVEGLRTLTRSNDDQLIGIGMAPAVLRDGVVKVHIVLNAAYVEGIDDDGAEEPSAAFDDALYLLAHECAHVAVTAQKDRTLPNHILQHGISGYEEAIFAQVNEACWEEYAACRLSAPFGHGRLVSYEEGLRGVLGASRERAAAARAAFWRHGDLNRVVGELGPPLAEPLRLAAYVLGHLDGLTDPPALSDATRRAIADAGYTDLIDDLAVALRDLWASREERTTLSEFEVIGDVARDAFWAGGLTIRPATDDGATIHVWEPDEVDPAALGLSRGWRPDA